jgi:Tfp pilus assembly PilM family ATPase
MSATAIAPRSPLRRIRETSAGWLGVDIGSVAIKLAQVGRSRSGWTLHLAQIIPAPNGAVIDRATISSGILDGCLNGQVCGLMRRRTSDAACVLSMAVMGMHSLELPPGSPHETGQMISMELDSAGEPAPREFDSFECSGLTAAEAGLTPRTVLSLPNAIGEAVADSLKRHKLQCQAIDSLPCAHARAVAMAEPHSSSTPSAVLDWGGTVPVFTLVRNGSPAYCRQLRSCGLRAIIGRAAHQRGFSEGDLHELLTAHVRAEAGRGSGISQTLGLLKEISADAARSMCDELARTLTFLRRQAASLVPETIWLMGGGALLPDIAPHLAALLDRPVRLWQLNAATGPSPGLADPMHAIFAPAIAASLLGVRS